MMCLSSRLADRASHPQPLSPKQVWGEGSQNQALVSRGGWADSVFDDSPKLWAVATREGVKLKIGIISKRQADAPFVRVPDQRRMRAILARSSSLTFTNPPL
jgi:hypothetical protein